VVVEPKKKREQSTPATEQRSKVQVESGRRGKSRKKEMSSDKRFPKSKAGTLRERKDGGNKPKKRPSEVEKKTKKGGKNARAVSSTTPLEGDERESLLLKLSRLNVKEKDYLLHFATALPKTTLFARTLRLFLFSILDLDCERPIVKGQIEIRCTGGDIIDNFPSLLTARQLFLVHRIESRLNPDKTTKSADLERISSLMRQATYSPCAYSFGREDKRGHASSCARSSSSSGSSSGTNKFDVPDVVTCVPITTHNRGEGSTST